MTAVLGKTGTGKSLWTKLYTQNNDRLLVFDPQASFENIEWLNHEMIFDAFDETGEIREEKFRLGAFEFESLETFANTAFVTGENLLVLEESSQIFEKARALPQWANRLTFMGRHKAVSMLVTAQRAASIPIDLRSQISRVISFRQTEKSDMKWLEEFFDKSQQAQIAALPNGECLDFHQNKITRVDIRPLVKKKFQIDIAP